MKRIAVRALRLLQKTTELSQPCGPTDVGARLLALLHSISQHNP